MACFSLEKNTNGDPGKIMTTLVVQDLSHAFGGLQAVDRFNLHINAGEIVGIIGPNGAGKTTVFNVLCGIYPLQRGAISLDQQSLAGLPIFQITRFGIARTFQNIRLFKALTALDNVKIAMNSRYTLTSAMLRRSAFRQLEEAATEEALQLLQRFGLIHYAGHRASELPYGLQRRLEIARALATHPKILLLDEPACGMNPSEAQAMGKLILEIQQEQQLAILLIDHQMPFVMSLCQRILVLNFGKTIAEGDPRSIRENTAVIESYLGGE